jgi:hypothetical protein
MIPKWPWLWRKSLLAYRPLDGADLALHFTFWRRRRHSRGSDRCPGGGRLCGEWPPGSMRIWRADDFIELAKKLAA